MSEPRINLSTVTDAELAAIVVSYKGDIRDCHVRSVDADSGVDEPGTLTQIAKIAGVWPMLHTALRERGFVPGLCHISSNDAAQIELLVAVYGADVIVNARDTSKWSALHKACAFGTPAAIKTLLAVGADPDAVTRTGYTPAQIIDRYAHCENVAEKHAALGK